MFGYRTVCRCANGTRLKEFQLNDLIFCADSFSEMARYSYTKR